jgi:predicted TIM-barrel fold metal-dependent hydrolase
VPVLHHAWYKATAEVASESTPAEVASLARRFPAVIFIMAHLGGGRERGVLDVADCANLLVDTSGSQPEAGMVEYAVRRLGPERVIFGSDWPIRDFGTQVGRVSGAELTPEEQELIFRGNAARLLAPSEEER